MMKFNQYINEDYSLTLNNQLINDSFKSACRNDHLNVVKYLVEKGADIHVNNEIALRNAIYYGNIDVIKFLVENGANIHILNNQPLVDSCSDGYLVVVKYLIEKGANIHSNDDEPLRRASNDGHLDVVKYLISNMDPQYVMDKLPQFTKYITDPKYSHIGLSNKFGVFEED